jgi:uncharacterized membrane protein
MHTNFTIDTFLWCLVVLIGFGMLAFLILGLLKGLYWEREVKMRMKRRPKYKLR